VPPLIGDAIVNARQTIPDMPMVLVPPVLGIFGVGSGTATLPAGAYFAVATARTNWGESIASNETSAASTVGLGQMFEVMVQVPFGASFIRLYYTAPNGPSGSEQQYTDYSVTSAQWGSTVQFNIISVGSPGIPPQLSRAWLPDTDGNLVSAAAIYGWLNDGLAMISRLTGGLLDYSGVQSQLGQPLYTIAGQWIEITSIWYDGYWMMGGDRGQFFRRNNITSQVLSSASISVINNTNILEVYPQPARTAASTTLASPMSATDTTATLANASGFMLPFGFLQVDNEQMAYAAINGSQLTGLIRGLGGSAAVAHAVNAPTLELNIFWSGKRQLAPSYAQGQSQSALPTPSGWEVLLAQYIGGRAKMVEHDTATWDAFNKSMETSIKNWGTSTKGVMRRRQVGGTGAPVSYYSDIAGGLIIP
jgi:hypothetical protein